MEPNWTAVEGSSNIAAFDYISGDPDTDTGTLFVRFAYGAEFRYENFPAQLAEDFFESESKGKFFHANIRNQYSGVRIEDDPEDTSEVAKLAGDRQQGEEEDGWSNEGGALGADDPQL